jgi:hypothetical protein
MDGIWKLDNVHCNEKRQPLCKIQAQSNDLISTTFRPEYIENKGSLNLPVSYAALDSLEIH